MFAKKSKPDQHPLRCNVAIGAAALALAALAALASTAEAQTEKAEPMIPGPSFKQVLSLNSVGRPRISPDGRSIAYLVRSTDWEDNRFDSEIWLARQGEEPFQLTRTKDGSSSGHSWSPDGRWIGFLADRGDKQQIFLINPRGGDAKQLTDREDGVSDFDWSPDGTRIAFAATDPKGEEMQQREEQYGKFVMEDGDFRRTHLWVISIDDEGVEPRRLTEGDGFTVGVGFSWSPDGTRIAFEHRPTPQPDPFGSDISLVDVESGEVSPLITRREVDRRPIWSPDGDWVLFWSQQDTASYRNGELARFAPGGNKIEVLTESFDEHPSAVAWTREGIWFVAGQRTERKLFRLDPESGRVRSPGDMPAIVNNVDVSADGNSVTFIGAGSTSMGEVYRTSTRRFRPEKVTDMTAQVNGWPLGTRELVRWNSPDGAEIEGVLFKPADYDPGRRYPLMVVIHGGPQATSRPILVSTSVYPIAQWLAKGAVILRPNYRGSGGYGEDFRALNVRNLGVGDAWDVLSGVDHLIEAGIADPERMGAMGWSQGGYISAFLATTSDAFRAISVGAGISDWMTYYVNTDIHGFTRRYLKATPWDDPEIYATTSPITYITGASTPTLIQHGEFDRRVPIPNAYQLYQGLQDVGVETQLIVYKDFGHGITKPKERLAAMWHNWQWFARYVWGEQVDTGVPVRTGG